MFSIIQTLFWLGELYAIAEYAAKESLLDLEIRYNKLNTDKSYWPTAYSRELAKEPCCLHLDNQEKGTFLRIVDETKEDILGSLSIILKLRSILCHFKEIGDSGIWEQVCNAIILDAEETVKGVRLCNYYVIWKLHTAVNAYGLLSRPIAAATDMWLDWAPISCTAICKEMYGSIPTFCKTHWTSSEFWETLWVTLSLLVEWCSPLQTWIGFTLLSGWSKAWSCFNGIWTTRQTSLQLWRIYSSSRHTLCWQITTLSARSWMGPHTSR